jgi:hypothetical protein
VGWGEVGRTIYLREKGATEILCKDDNGEAAALRFKLVADSSILFLH